MNIERLALLAHMLRRHSDYFPSTTFDLSHWVLGGNAATCGTAACAVGSAMYWKPFQDMGLHSIEYAYRHPIYRVDGQASFIGWSAVHHFFDISQYTADFLFLEEEYELDEDEVITPEMVADRIDAVILEHIQGEQNDTSTL